MKIDKRPLKAYVRFDGTGRIVPSSLILRRKKPKVGKWVEIPAYECCNDTTTTLPPALRLTFDSIESANSLVGDASSVSDWNTFFDLPAYGNPFTSVSIIGNTVYLIGGSNIEVVIELFAENENLVSVYDEGAITIIGESAFGGCPALETAYFAACTETIYTGENLDYGTFGSCDALTQVDLPAITTIGEFSFYDTPALATININPAITYIGPRAFRNATGLTSINLPNVTGTGNVAFGDCTSLVSVNAPALLSINPGTFGNCTSLTSVNAPLLQNVGNAAFSACTSLVSISLPSASIIGAFQFNDCTSLTSISLPACTNLGGTVGDDGVFNLILGNTITLTVPSALMTIDAGNPDGDIQALLAGNTVTVITV